MPLFEGPFACRDVRVPCLLLAEESLALCVFARELAVGAINVDEVLFKLRPVLLGMLLWVPGPDLLVDPLCF
jgi:hypothetical protein